MGAQGFSRQNEPISYMDFEIEIGPGQASVYPVKVLHAQGGETPGELRFPYNDQQLSKQLLILENIILRSSGNLRQALSSDEKNVREFGKALFDALFDGDVRGDYNYSFNFAHQQQKGLRLKLRILPPELAALPWEFLFDSRRNDYVCLSRYSPVVRYLPLNRPIEPFEVTLPLNILVMFANPNDLPPIQFKEEKDRLFESLHPLVDQKLAEVKILPGETWRDLQDAMLGGPWHIYHYIGHGGFDERTDEGYILLKDEKRGTMRPLSASKLARLLADHPSLRLALLNSCEGGRGSAHDIYSSTAAILVSHGIPAALGMQYTISDQAAIEFTLSFYDKIARGFPVDAAVTEARKSVSMTQEQTVEWVTPVLFMHVPDGILFRLIEKTTEQLAKEELERLRLEQFKKEEVQRKEQAEQERLAREKSARDEAERVARDEAVRKAREQAIQEEADRKAREKAAQDEADRIRHEEEIRLARERFLREQAEQKERERAEQQRAEEARQAREKAAREDADRKAREERQRKEREKAAADELNRQVADLESQLNQAEANADWNTAIGVGRQIMGLVANHPSAKKRTAQAYISRAAVNRDKKQYKSAINDLNKALELDKTNNNYLAERANVEYLKGDYDHAIDDYTRLIQRESENSYHYQGRGKCYYQKGEIDKAYSDLTNAIARDPNRAVLYANRSAYYSNDYNSAIADLTKAIELNPQEPDYYYWRACNLHDQKKFQKGIDDCSQSIKLNDKKAEYFHMRGLCRDGLSEKQSASKRSSSSLLSTVKPGTSWTLKPESPLSSFTRRPKTDYSTWLTPSTKKPISLSDTSFKFDLALMDFSKAVELAPEEPFYYVARGVHQHNIQQYDAALKDFSSAIKLAPQVGEYYYRRGFTYAVRGQVGKPTLTFQYAELNKKKQDREAAIKDLEKAISLGYTQAQSLLDKVKSQSLF